MPKGDEKYVFTDKMVLKYPELKEFITNGGRFNKLKRIEIIKVLNEEEKQEYGRLFNGKDDIAKKVEANINGEAEEEQKKYEFILGDCIEKLKLLEDKSVDLVVTSPPYNIGLKYNKYEDKKPREQYLEWIYDIFIEIKRVLKDDGHIFLNMGYTNRDPWISMEVALKLKDLFVKKENIF